MIGSGCAIGGGLQNSRFRESISWAFARTLFGSRCRVSQLCTLPDQRLAKPIAVVLKRLGLLGLYARMLGQRRSTAKLPKRLVFKVDGTVADAMASLRTAYVHQLRSLPPAGATLDLLQHDGARAMELTYWWGDILVDRWHIALMPAPSEASVAQCEVRVERTLSPNRRSKILLGAMSMLALSTLMSLASMWVLPTLAWCLLGASLAGWWMTFRQARADDHEQHAHRVLAAAWGGKQIQGERGALAPLFRR